MELVEVLLPVLLIVALTATVASAGNHSSLQDITTAPPSNCPKSCGNITIKFPFGIGHGCYRSARFNLTCSDNTSSRLFLGNTTIEVLEIDTNQGFMYIKSLNATLGVADNYKSTSFDLKNLPYSFNLGTNYQFSNYGWTMNNIWHVTGCSAAAYLIDAATDTIIDSCSTLCSPTVNLTSGGNCTMHLHNWKAKNRTSLEVRLVRLNQTDEVDSNMSAASITAVMYDSYRLTDEELVQELVMQGNIKGELNATLVWYVDDDNRTTCAQAKNNTATYACRCSSSDCFDAFPSDEDNKNYIPGYLCRCSLSYSGNPYEAKGCYLDHANFRSHPAKDCQMNCGDVTVPFPFGLKKECCRGEAFALQCSNKTLHYQDIYKVKNISIDEALILLDTKDLDYTLSSDEVKPLINNIDQAGINFIIENRFCKDAMKDKTTYACVAENSNCIDNKHEFPGYHCKCSHGYEGNPYIRGGCKDIDECRSATIYCNGGICINKPGSYDCIRKKNQFILLGIIIGVTSGIGLLILCASYIILRRRWNKRQQKKMRQRYFKQNHGILLTRQISSGDDVPERTKIFSLKEIEKATDNFDKTRVLGRGGHGTVYKGILSDQRVVAIKKSKIAKKLEIDQFINEVVVLSQINHRHVVKLYGCCLETEVPLLIYEFISNGTLSDHLHLPNGTSVLSWDDRLRIATEAAEALSYLHSAASISIFHRDVKSSNILLDDHLTAKVSDFGASRLIPLDETHLVTNVQGTFGYLDPEYYQTSQLTEKSDVYSFGVILLELLTGKKPIYSDENEGTLSLSMHFFQALKDNKLFHLIEDSVMNEATKEELMEIIGLTEMSLRLKGCERPTMKEVELKLQGLMRRFKRKKTKHSIAEDNEEAKSLLSDSSYAVSQLVDEGNQGTSINYSMEKEIMQSYLPR